MLFRSVIHLAAESHVDRSITDPFAFIRTNVFGTCNLLQAARMLWSGRWEGHRFYHISTDEVYGALSKTDPMFTETTRYAPHSPYSASKASSDHFVRAFHDTYGLPTVISNCSNNYGSHHFPEKLIPLAINNIQHNRPIPVYGKGENVRDWLFVDDHAAAIDLIFHKGKDGDTYNIGGNNEKTNIEITKLILNAMGKDESSIQYVTDRLGHDRRYAISNDKIQSQLGWEPSLTFEEGIKITIDWYLNNQDWVEDILNGNYKKAYTKK